jgi:hypothetical protein
MEGVPPIRRQRPHGSLDHALFNARIEANTHLRVLT